MQYHNWAAGDTLGGVANELLNDPFKFTKILEDNVDIPINYTFSDLFTQPVNGQLIKLTQLATDTANQFLVGSGGRIALTTAGGEAFIDFSKIADTNSVLAALTNQLQVGTVKIADFRF